MSLRRHDNSGIMGDAGGRGLQEMPAPTAAASKTTRAEDCRRSMAGGGSGSTPAVDKREGDRLPGRRRGDHGGREEGSR